MYDNAVFVCACGKYNKHTCMFEKLNTQYNTYIRTFDIRQTRMTIIVL